MRSIRRTADSAAGLRIPARSGGQVEKPPKKPIKEPPRKPDRPGRDVPKPVPIDDPQPPKPAAAPVENFLLGD